MVSAAIKSVFALDDADATFDTGMKSSTTPEPTLPLVLAAHLRLAPRLGKNDSFHTQLDCKGFVRG